MLKMTSCLAAAWLLMAPLAAVAAAALQSVPSDGRVTNSATVNATVNAKVSVVTSVLADQSARRYAQNNPARPQPPAARKNPQAQGLAQGQSQGPPQVYLLRGFLNVFSLGMDDLAGKLQADGIPATVTNHADADFVASRILSAYNGGDHGPVVLIGHSLGADAVVEVADALARYNIPVALLVMFDGTAPHQIPGNVVSAINYTKHFMVTPGYGSRGAVSNVDLSGDPGIDHLSIDTAPSLQAQTLNYVLQATSPVSPAPPSRRQ